jgi:hypothetical protein
VAATSSSRNALNRTSVAPVVRRNTAIRANRDEIKENFIKKQADKFNQKVEDFSLKKAPKHMAENEPSGNNFFGRQNHPEEEEGEQRGAQMFNARRNTVGEAGEKINKAAQDAAAKVQKAGQSVTDSVKDAADKVTGKDK